MKTKSSKSKNAILKTVTYVILCLHAVICLLPLFWTLISSLKTNDSILVTPFSLPTAPKIGNYTDAWNIASLGTGIMNNLVVCITTTFSALIISGLAAYATVKVYRHIAFYGFFIIGLMIPVLSILIPIKIILTKLGLLNNLYGLIIVYVAYYFSISYLLLYGFISTQPPAIEESAYIDGCGALKVFLYVVFPMSIPGFATAGVMILYQSWNEYMLPLVLITDSNKKLLLQCVQLLGSNLTLDYGILLAGIIISTIPIVVLYSIGQQYIVAGVTAGAVKG